MYAHNRQNISNDCGLACLKTIFDTLQIKTPKNFIDYCNLSISNQGLTLFDLSNIMDFYGLQNKACFVEEVETLSTVNFPIIALVEKEGVNHYIVVHQKVETDFVVSDPVENEVKKVQFNEFIKMFKNKIIFITDVIPVDITKLKSDKKSKQKIVKLSDKTYTFDYMLFVFQNIIHIFTPILLILSIQFLLNYKIEMFVDAKMLIYSVICFALFISIYYYNSIFLKDKELKMENRILKQEMNKFFEKYIGDINGDTNIFNLSGYFWNTIALVSGVIQKNIVLLYNLFFMFSIILLFFISKFDSLLLLLFFLMINLILLLNKKSITNIQREYIASGGKLSLTLEETLQASMDIQIFSSKKKGISVLDKSFYKYLSAKEKMEILENRILTQYDIFTYALLLSLFIKTVISYNQDVSVNMMFQFIIIFYVYILFSLYKTSISKWIAYRKSIVAIDYIETVDSTENSKNDLIINNIYIPIEEISLKNIKFGYKDEKTLFENDNFEFNSGEISCIYGDNGSGKSTLMMLLMGIYTPITGERIINNSVYKGFIPRNISYYSPNLFLFSNSINENILLKLYEADDTMTRAMDNTLLEKLNSDIVLMSNGANISQGERQRVLLKRALQKDKDIYIFDEPTTNLDESNVSILKEELIKLKTERKIVIILTHDESLKDIADSVYRI